MSARQSLGVACHPSSAPRIPRLLFCILLLAFTAPAPALGSTTLPPALLDHLLRGDGVIIFALAFVAAQSLLVAALLAERRRRKAAEIKSRRQFLELVHLNQCATAGALSGAVAHELNQPLGAIRSNAEAAEMLLRSDAPDLTVLREIVEDIRNDDQRADDIVHRFRRLLKRRQEIEWQEFDLNEVVGNALRILRPEAERKRIALSATPVARSLPVLADRLHVQQVVLNLATNAMDSVLDAAVEERRVVVATALVDASSAEVAVFDTGSGIPAERLGSVFETFYSTKPGGTGLGLTIARTIVETYGGRIWAGNRVDGAGAVMRFVLPLAGT